MRPKFSKKHYEVLAQCLLDTREEITRAYYYEPLLVEAKQAAIRVLEFNLIELLQKDNPGFSLEKFIEASGRSIR